MLIVCGEYISMESWDFIKSLGLDLDKLSLPKINKLHITGHNGFKVSSELHMGGFGISRYTLDNELVNIAKQKGVTVLENCKATDVTHLENKSIIASTLGTYQAKLVCGSFGKIAPLFMERNTKKNKTNYIAVKYHIKTDFPENLIELHNFKNGYCGISTVDKETQCVCYLTTSENLQNNNNDIKQLEKNVLMQNPYLKHYFMNSIFLYEKPLSISNISFQPKQTYQNGILLLGDSAGTIAPLCGNGMSMALRSSFILETLIANYLQNKITKQELIDIYKSEWNNLFNKRIKTGYYLQKLFGKKTTTLLSLYVLRAFPILFKKIISFTHGNYIIKLSN